MPECLTLRGIGLTKNVTFRFNAHSAFGCTGMGGLASSTPVVPLEAAGSGAARRVVTKVFFGVVDNRPARAGIGELARISHRVPRRQMARIFNHIGV